jgi:hypothetical protein
VSESSLEDRVAELERLVHELASKLVSTSNDKNWQRSVGKFKGDPIMREIIDEGERLREEDRRRAD